MLKPIYLAASARLKASAVSTSLAGCLQRIAKTVDPVHAKDKTAPALGPNICHGAVALAIKKRGNPEDLIWFYGVRFKDQPQVEHSVLTNEDHEVIADTFKKNGKFLGTKGYFRNVPGADVTDTFLAVVPVSELYDDYMSYEINSAVSDKVEKKDKQRNKENIDRQLETNKERQDTLRDSKKTMDPAQKLQVDEQVNGLQHQAIELKKRKSEASMYSYLLNARIKPESDYQFFTYKAAKPVVVNFRGNPIVIDKGTKFGVRKSSNGKHIRLIRPNEPTRVITIDLKTAEDLAKGV